MEDRIKDIITPKIKELLESTYYHDISRDDIWNQLIVTFATNHTQLAAQIESMADNGIANVRRLATLCLEHFQLMQNTFTTNNDLEAQQFYLILLCYFHNCYIAANKTFIKDIPLAEKIGFFYQTDLVNILQNIYNESKINIDPFLNNLSQISGQQLTPETILRELLLLPFLLEHIADKNIRELNEIKKTALAIVHDSLHSSQTENAFAWLKENPQASSFINDIINTINIFIFIKKIYLSCGAKKLYGYQQRLIDKQSGNVLYSIPYKTQMFLLKGDSALIAGQANINNIEILSNGNLLVEFQHGQFFDDVTTDQAAFNTALAINEYLLPCLSIFSSAKQNNETKLNILFESPHANPNFSEKVKEQLDYLSPETAATIKILPSLKIAPKMEQERYLAEKDIELTKELQDQIINNIRLAGYKSSFVLPESAFQNVKLIELTPQTILCEEGKPAVFVYIPFTEGLTGHSTQEGICFRSKAWAPVGHIGAIQDGLRTATVIAEQQVKLLMIPATVYLRYWHADYTVSELDQRINELKSG